MTTIPPTPRILWIELTSKCPYDCVFCSRKLRRGAGEHMPFALYQRLLDELDRPRKLLLNYSGESLVYPDLIPAIKLGRDRGASVELVSAFSLIDPRQVSELARSGLNRLTISIHSVDPDQYTQIYGYSSYSRLTSRLREFLDECREIASPPAVDFAFVAMKRNLHQLAEVAALAEKSQVSNITVFPVIRRDNVVELFDNEVLQSAHTQQFRSSLLNTVCQIRAHRPTVELNIANPSFETGSACLGEVPAAFPAPLPPGARIHSCEQNPFETAHVLSNGDVVVCEVHDRVAIGNLQDESMRDIWNGARYQEFRRRYSAGEEPGCATCVWKTAYRPRALKSDILAREGNTAQLGYGWHSQTNEPVIWASPDAVAAIRPRSGSRLLHVNAVLPPGPPGDPNELVISCNESEIGRVSNIYEENMPFGLDFKVEKPNGELWNLRFQTKHVFRPTNDARDLGVGLVMLTSKRPKNTSAAPHLNLLRNLIRATDRVGTRLRRIPPERGRPHGASSEQPGISVIIPERGNSEVLAECLAALEIAVRQVAEPVETIIIASDAAPEAYRALKERYPFCSWIFCASPATFNSAVLRGLRAARYDWVYLLNNDVTLSPDALVSLLPCRAPDVFAIGSHILLRDHTRFPEETNWSRLFIADGLAAVHDLIPNGASTVEGLYAGGGASLFRRSILRSLAAATKVYEPFYWEDVEWGWRARKMGYRVLFCPDSIVHHQHRATVDKYYAPDEVELITERNRLLFQLRNLPAAGSRERMLEEIAVLPDRYRDYFLRPSVVSNSLKVRLWNQRSVLSDLELLDSIRTLES